MLALVLNLRIVNLPGKRLKFCQHDVEILISTTLDLHVDGQVWIVLVINCWNGQLFSLVNAKGVHLLSIVKTVYYSFSCLFIQD